MTRKRRGFTLIEILAAVTIIAILLGMLLIGAKYIGASTREKKTHVLLKTLQGMLADFEGSGGRMEIITDQYLGLGNQEMMPKGGVGDDFANSNPQLKPALQRTQNVMLALMTLPGNKSIIDKLPPEVFMMEPGTKQRKVGPILLDAWNSPILFAPGRSSTGVGIKQWGATGMTILKDPNATAGNSSFQPPDGKGLFISAGVDQDFSKGDDNVYSSN